MKHRHPHLCMRRGFTLIELLVVVALVAIIAALAAPSFTSFLARKRLEGAASELATDLQYARSEAVQRNAAVTVTFGTDCYVIHTAATTVACTRTSKSITPAAAELKTMQLLAGTNAAFAPQASLTSITFDAVRGMATFGGVASGTTTGSVLATSSATTGQVRVDLNAVGRVSTCSPSTASIAGYSACTS